MLGGVARLALCDIATKAKCLSLLVPHMALFSPRQTVTKQRVAGRGCRRVVQSCTWHIIFKHSYSHQRVLLPCCNINIQHNNTTQHNSMTVLFSSPQDDRVAVNQHVQREDRSGWPARMRDRAARREGNVLPWRQAALDLLHRHMHHHLFPIVAAPIYQ